MSELESSEQRLYGINASPGICIGKAYIVDKEGADVVEKYCILEGNLQDEINRFKAAVKKTKDELHQIIENSQEDLGDHTNILETQILLLKDKLLYGKTIEAIENQKINAEWALKKIVTDVNSMFMNMSDTYLKQRANDIVQLYDRIIRNLVGAEQVNIGKIDKRVILVANDLSPADTSQIHLERVKGFITDRGGRDSHTGIIARTLEIPAVLGLGNATRKIKHDELIIVDGINGVVISHPTEQTLLEFSELSIEYERKKAVITRKSHLQAKTKDGQHIKVMGNIELPEEVFSVINYGGDGIGLYRTEFQFLSRPDFPSEFELFDKYKDVAEVMAPKPITIRTLDINGDKAIKNTTDSYEPNPALGLRAIRYCLKNQEIFKTQLRAILRAAAYGNLRILFPMISSIEEIEEAKRLLDEAADSLDKEDIIFNRDIEIGIMIEVPSAAILADLMAETVDFFSFGTNDLIQYSLAIDRGNNQVAHLFNPLHPAILRLLKHTSDVAKEKGIKLSICGEMAGTPHHIPILLGMGLDELSMNPQSIPPVKNVIRSLKKDDTQLFLKEVMKQRSSKQVFDLIENTYGEILAESTYR